MKRDKHINAIVIGAGASGGIMAKELAAYGLSVVLFERGDWAKYDTHNHDELVSQRIGELAPAFGPDPKLNPRLQILPNGQKVFTRPNSWDYSHIATCVGSGTVSYGAMAWRFMPEDFTMCSTYGHVEGSTLEDWPLTYEELEPFYEKAEWEIGVAGSDEGNPFAPPRKRERPMPAFPYNSEGRLYFDTFKKMGLHPFPIPMLRNSIRYNGRGACILNRHCLGFACPVDAKNGTQNTVIPIALRTGNCELRTNCVVAEIIVDDSGRTKGVHYFDARRKGHFQSADIVVVCASAIESARLLLNSKSKLFPNGAGNNNDWVGRNIQGHAYTGAKGIFDRDIQDMTGPGACVAVCDFNHHNQGLVGGGALYNGFNKMPYGFSQDRPEGEPKWGAAHKKFQRDNFYRFSGLSGPIQEIPAFEASVTVVPEVKDAWGLPVAALRGRPHPLNRKNCEFLSEKAEAILKEAGAIKTWQNIGGGGEVMNPSQHQAGTCRMGNDPQTSVTNRYGQIHGIDNLFVADASIFVTNGGFNPVLTIMAASYWVAHYIKREWNGTRFKA